MKAPATSPCGSCPYRRDVPSGIWDPTEYAKLPAYDQPTPYQPAGVFLCHQVNGHICGGWAGRHDTAELMSLRLAVLAGELTDDDYTATLDYRSPIPLFDSGQEAADHGLAEVEEPGDRARQTIGKLASRRGR